MILFFEAKNFANFSSIFHNDIAVVNVINRHEPSLSLFITLKQKNKK